MRRRFQKIFLCRTVKWGGGEIIEFKRDEQFLLRS